MNEPNPAVRHPRPPRPIRSLVNPLMTAILRSRWHRLRSDRLLLLTFTGYKSGKEFTTPIHYVQEGETLRIVVVYPWWKNLVGGTTVHVLLRGHTHTGTAEVFPERYGEAVVKIHLQD